MTKSYTLVENTPTWFDVLVKHLTNIITNKSKSCLKPGRPIGSRDTIPWKRKKKEKHMKKVGTLIEVKPKNGLLNLINQPQVNNQMASKEAQIIQLAHEEAQILQNNEIYVS